MKDIQETFGADPRFLLVGCRATRPPGSREVHQGERAGLDTGVRRKLLEGVAETYLIRAIPATFLIAPDGRVLAMNLRGRALKRLSETP